MFVGEIRYADAYRIHVKHIKTELEVANSPFAVRVVPSIPNALASFHNLETDTLDTSDEVDFLLQIYAADEFNNLVSSGTGYTVTIFDISSGFEETVELESPSFSTNYKFRKSFRGKLVISFLYNGEHIKNSPSTITCSSSALAKERCISIIMYVGGGSLVLLFIGSLLLSRFRKNARISHYRLNDQIILNQESEKEAKALIMVLTEELKIKNHSDEEIILMRASLDSMNRQRFDELREVIVSSEDVKIVRLLKEGGFGSVHLGTFKGGQVAIKQMKRITRSGMDRFRFECFLMKSLRHPNVVRLIGVCWDFGMLACLMEYMANGSLKYHLANDFNRSKGDIAKLTWKANVYKLMLDAAQGAQYLHNSRYFDLITEVWKEEIVHRDLKPDNMLVTNSFALKLTDFGESRAVEADLTSEYGHLANMGVFELSTLNLERQCTGVPSCQD